MKNLLVSCCLVALPLVGFCQTDTCDLGREVDDFTNEINLSTPPYVSSNMQLLKSIKKGVARFYLNLSAKGATYVTRPKGVTVLFADGKKWSKPAEDIDANISGGWYGYSSFIALNAADMVLFTTKSVAKYRLYIFDQSIEPEEAEKFKTSAKCIKSAK